VTGANVGLGLEASVKFVQLGAAKVILAVRSLSKGEHAKKQIERRTGRTGVLDVWHLDMLDYNTIKAFADRANEELERLDIAVLNAGLAKIEFQQSQYGWEETLQVNLLSTTLLALLLMPKLKASKTSTFIPVMEIVGSSNHFMVTKLNSETEPLASYNKPEGFFGPSQYSVSKLLLMYAETALAQLAMSKETGKPDVYVTVCCPGATVSDLAREASAWYYKIGLVLFRLLAQRPTEAGARTYISGVTQGEPLHGRFWKDDTIRE
jgi:NAD(P)-dependent dehydrogenase (short-subunit alcohol dehydrogenase family)